MGGGIFMQILKKFEAKNSGNPINNQIMERSASISRNL
jgi:hypothetical protein